MEKVGVKPALPGAAPMILDGTRINELFSSSDILKSAKLDQDWIEKEITLLSENLRIILNSFGTEVRRLLPT